MEQSVYMCTLMNVGNQMAEMWMMTLTLIDFFLKKMGLTFLGFRAYWPTTQRHLVL